MKKLLLVAALSLAVLPAMAQSLSSKSLTVTGVRDVAFITQNGGGASAHIGPLSVSSRGYSSRKLATPSGGSPGALPLVPVSSPVAEDVALEAARVWAVTYMPGYAARVGGWLRSRGVGMGYYSFTQPITIASTIGGLRAKKISFIAAVDSGGGVMYGNPKIIDDNPLYLDVKYLPRRVAEGLPQTARWQLPEPGTLQWRLINANGSPVGGSLGVWHLVAGVNGHFDPSTSSGDTNPMEKVPCLVDKRNMGCNAGLPDVRTMMTQTGASFGRLNYFRPVEPFYQSAGDGTMIPMGTIQITSRHATCDRLWESGNFELALDLRADQFTVTPATPLYRHEWLSEITQMGIGPAPAGVTGECSGGGCPMESYSVSLIAEQAWPLSEDQPLPWNEVMLNPAPAGDLRYWTMEDANRVGLVVQSVPLIEDEPLANCPRNTSRDPVLPPAEPPMVP